jgi:hypothetical protein
LANNVVSIFSKISNPEKPLDVGSLTAVGLNIQDLNDCFETNPNPDPEIKLPVPVRVVNNDEGLQELLRLHPPITTKTPSKKWLIYLTSAGVLLVLALYLGYTLAIDAFAILLLAKAIYQKNVDAGY